MSFSPLLSIIGITLSIIIGGEPAVMLLSFASTGEHVSLVAVIVVGYLTAVIGDILWFSVVRKFSAIKIKSWRFIGKAYRAYVKEGNKIGQKSPLKMLFLARSFYGGGLATIIYLAGTSLSITKLIKYSLFVNAFWLSVSVILGWSAGKGFQYALRFFVNMKISITIIVALLIVSYFIFYKIKKK